MTARASKSAAIRAMHEMQPHMSQSELAATLNCTRQLVTSALTYKPSGKPRGAKPRKRKRGETYRVSMQLSAAEREAVRNSVAGLHGRTMSSVIAWCVRVALIERGEARP